MNVLTRIVTRSLLAAVVALSSAPALAQTASTVPAPVITIATFDAQLGPLVFVPVFTWRSDGRPLAFSATVTRSDSRPVDVYFGVMVPGGRIFSWTGALTSIPLLLEGLVPAAQGTTDSTFSTATLFGTNPRHAFSAEAPIGLYAVFMLLVPQGADPTDPGRWLAATMSPLTLSR